MLEGSIAELGRLHRRHIVKTVGESWDLKQHLERGATMVRSWYDLCDTLLLISSYAACLLYSGR